MQTRQLRSSLLLLLGAFIWGTAFVAQSAGGQLMGAYTYNGIRNFIGALVLIPAISFLDAHGFSTRAPETKADRKLLLKAGLACGIALFAGSTLQQIGLNMGADTGRAGFITTLYIILVPLGGIFFKKKCGINIWIGAVIAMCGMYFLCGMSSFSLKDYDIALISCAIAFTVQISLLGVFSSQVDPVRLAQIEFLVTGIISIIPIILVDIPAAGGLSGWLLCFASTDAIITILYAGILSSGVAYTLQAVSQADLNPTVASMIMSLEAVFSAISGAVILHQFLSAGELTGCILIFSAIIIAQLPVGKSGQ